RYTGESSAIITFNFMVLPTLALRGFSASRFVLLANDIAVLMLRVSAPTMSKPPCCNAASFLGAATEMQSSFHRLVGRYPLQMQLGRGPHASMTPQQAVTALSRNQTAVWGSDSPGNLAFPRIPNQLSFRALHQWLGPEGTSGEHAYVSDEL